MAPRDDQARAQRRFDDLLTIGFLLIRMPRTVFGNYRIARAYPMSRREAFHWAWLFADVDGATIEDLLDEKFSADTARHKSSYENKVKKSRNEIEEKLVDMADVVDSLKLGLEEVRILRASELDDNREFLIALFDAASFLSFERRRSKDDPIHMLSASETVAKSLSKGLKVVDREKFTEVLVEMLRVMGREV